MAHLRRYRARNFVFDLFMLVITCGIWILWIAIRELRNLAGSR